MPQEASLAAHGLPLLYTLLVWWFSTGVVLYLDGLPPRTFRWSLLGASVVGVGALLGLWATSADATRAGAYAAFTCAVLVWGWNEMAFLMGFVTGPRRVACPEGCGGWSHFGHAVEAILYHELALVASGAAVVAVTWGGVNRVGAWTFAVLWVMRLSAKLNVFLGVPVPGESFLPEHLRYLGSFFSRRAMNALFPVSVTASTLVTAALVERALVPGASAFEIAGTSLVAALLGLAVLEHWFLVVPLPTEVLWRWGMRSRVEPQDDASGRVVLLHRRRDESGATLEQEGPKRRRDR